MNPGDDDSDVVDQLPNTGSGAVTTGGDEFFGLPTMLSLLALTGGLAYGLRRRAIA